jgi:ABC-type transport system involved in cytochrome bd biosynthesis fused ATPase/permease subunit
MRNVKPHQQMTAQNLTRIDRALVNLGIVAGLITIGMGITFLATGWAIAKAALWVAGPVATIAVFAAPTRTVN